MQALRNNSLQISSIVSDQIDCAVTRGGIEPCREQDDGLRVWAVGGFNNARIDSDGNGIGHETDSTHALLGVDYTISNFTIGAFGGYRRAKSSFDLYGGEVKAEGWQLGLAAGYDGGDFYIRANGSYSQLNGDSRRTVSVLSTNGGLTGEPDFRLTSIYAEAGGRIAVGSTWVTPFVGLEYTNVKMKAFTETGVAGANLAFADQSQNQTSFLAGVKWAGKLGVVIPEAKVAWRNDSNGNVFSTTQRLVDAPAGAFFTTNSPVAKTDSVMAGFSLAAMFTEKVTGRIGYQGRFASDLKDNAFYGSLVVRF
jgi:outer membrane autotransporter protein